MPFITEEIWQSLPHAGEGPSIMVAKWPVYDEKLSFAQEEADFQKVMDLIKAIRNQRAEMNIPPAKKAKVYIQTGETGVFRAGAPFLERLASAQSVEVGERFDLPGAVQVITPAAKALIPMEQLIDKEKELARLTKEKEKCLSDIAFVEKKLLNEAFVAKAPPQVVEAERKKIEVSRQHLARLMESIAALE